MPIARRSPPEISDEEEARIQAGIAADPDNPEITEEQFARMRPASEVLPPELYAKLVRGPGRPTSPGATRVPISLRVDPSVLRAYRATGPGWQTRMNEALAAGVAKYARGRSVKGEV